MILCMCKHARVCHRRYEIFAPKMINNCLFYHFRGKNLIATRQTHMRAHVHNSTSQHAYHKQGKNRIAMVMRMCITIAMRFLPSGAYQRRLQAALKVRVIVIMTMGALASAP